MGDERLSRDELRQRAAEVFGVDTQEQTELKAGLEKARRVMEKGGAAVAVMASGMDKGTLHRIQTAFDPENQQPDAA